MKRKIVFGLLITVFVINVVYIGGGLALDTFLRIVTYTGEDSRITSPDGLVDAVVMEYDAGATTSLIYSVYVVPAG